MNIDGGLTHTPSTLFRRRFLLFVRCSVAPFVVSLSTLVHQLTPQLRPSLLRRSILTAGAPGSSFIGACAPPPVYRASLPAVGGRNPHIIYTLYIYTLYIYVFSNNMADMVKNIMSAVGLGAGASSGAAPQTGGARRSRCPRGSRRNKAGDCVKYSGYTAKKRCPRGTRRNAKSGVCEKIEMLLRHVGKSQRQVSSTMKSSVKKVNQVAKAALVEVVELKKADVAVAAAGVDRLAAARAAAALKRQKKAAAADARMKGKIAAAEAREKEAERVETAAEKEREDLLARIARTRKAMGIRKNEENPAALRRLIEQWEMEARMRIFNKGEGPKQVEPSMGA